jgi:hypothetical protein
MRLEARHMSVVVTEPRWRNWRHLFRQRWLVRCWKCDLREGPFDTHDQAFWRAHHLYGEIGSNAPWCNQR